MCYVAQDDSLSLARLLQEQERAYFMMQFGGGGVPDATEDAAGEDEEEDESLALARALQEEEEQEYRNRILAMAGIDPDAEEEDSDAEGIDTDAMTYEELCELGDSVGKVVCGLTDAQIESLPIVVIDESTQGTKCAVCQVEFELGEDARELPRCRHVYHFECVQPWFAANKACPTCKTEVFEDKSTNI